MSRHFLIIIVLISSLQANAQTGIGTTTPHTSAKLDVFSTNKGFLPPRVSLTGINDNTTIPTPATGLLVYCKGDAGLSSGYYFWNGTTWATIATSEGSNSVEYVSVQASSDLTITAGTSVKFNTTLAGNIPYDVSTGFFTLSAGKTYRISGFVSLAGGQITSPNAEAITVWRTSSGSNIGNYAQILSGNSNYNSNGQGVTDFIYTPITNTSVSLYVNSITNNVGFKGGYTSATITQIGSSAIINPWTLSGTNTFNTTGNIGIGITSPNASAILDISSTTKGITFPRMTTTQRNAISSPTTGLQVFDITTNSIWYFDGSTWVNSVSVASFGDIKTGIQVGDHNGWIRLNGRAKSTLSATQQAQATALGIGTNLPDASNAYLVQNGRALGDVFGDNTKTISKENLPLYDLPTATTNSTGNHTHTFQDVIHSENRGQNNRTVGTGAATDYDNDPYTRDATTASSGNHSHTVTVSSGGSGTAFNITPKSLSVNTFIYLGN